MPMFLRVPPKPVDSWPLKWVRLIKISASMMARPIFAVLQYSPFGTQRLLRPLSGPCILLATAPRDYALHRKHFPHTKRLLHQMAQQPLLL